MTKALVTGASGFIGYHLVRRLVEQGNQVTALVRSTSRIGYIRPLGVRLVYGDVTDPESLRQAVAGQDVVYHLAGLVKARRRRELYRVNQEGVRHVCEACGGPSSPPTLVLVSTLAAAGPSPGDRPRVESDPPAPVSHYGRSKRAGEKVAERFAEQLPITIVRPPIVFGEADQACLRMFWAIKWTGIHFVPGFVPRRYSVIHAADLAELLIRAARSGQRVPGPDRQEGDGAGRGYYFADCGWQPTYYQLGRLMARAMGRRFVLTLPCGPLVTWATAAVCDVSARLRGGAAYLSVDKAREALAGSWVCSGQKAAEQLGFRVTASLEQRLKETVAWYRQQRWL